MVTGIVAWLEKYVTCDFNFLKTWNVSERIWMMLAQYSVSTRLWMEFILIQTKFAYKGPLLNYAMHICTHIAQPYSIGVLKFMLNLVTTTDGVFHAQYPEDSSIFKVSDNAFLSTSMGRLNIPCPSPLPQQHKKVRNIRVIKLQRFFIPCPPLLPPQKTTKIRESPFLPGRKKKVANQIWQSFVPPGQKW